MIEKRVDDKAFMNLVRKWLKAGILEADGQVTHPLMGTPQGGNAPPILANVHLHTVLDGRFGETARTYCTGHAYLCRYADDFVCAFQHGKDAQRFYKALVQRLARFGPEAAGDEARIIESSHCKALAKRGVAIFE